MFACGSFMVLMQTVAITSICAGMLWPTCVDSKQCPGGQFCYHKPDEVSGRCLYCGELAPLVPYFETTGDETGYGPTGKEVIWNRNNWECFPEDRMFGLYRSDVPTRFAGFNDSHVEATCTRPFKSFQKYEVEWSDMTWYVDGRPRKVVESFTGGDVPNGIIPADAFNSARLGDEYTAKSVGSWCDACVNGVTKDVSNWDEHGMGRTFLMAMSLLDVSYLSQ